MSGPAHSNQGCGKSSCACKSASSSSNPDTVKLPKRQNDSTSKSGVWSLSNSTEQESSPLLPKSAVPKYLSHQPRQYSASGIENSIDSILHKQPKKSLADKCDRPEGTCCKDEVKEERKLIDPDVVRDM